MLAGDADGSGEAQSTSARPKGDPVRRTTRFLAAGAALVALAGTLFVAGPTAASGPKTYDPDATPIVYVGTTTTISVTIVNTSRNDIAFNGARVWVPSLLRDRVNGPIRSSSGSPTYDAATGRIQVSDANVGRRASLVVTVPVRLPCGATGTGTWTTDIRQSNDFNGTDNKFAMQGPDPTTTIAGACRLEFAVQPQDAAPGDRITGSDYDPSGPDVAVAVKDGRPSGSTTVSWLTGLSVSLASTPAATFTGTSATTVAGVASFPGLTTLVDGTYRLVASATGTTPATSAEFVVLRTRANVDCVSGDGSNCSTGIIRSVSGQTAAVEVQDQDGLEATLSASFGPSTIDCPYYDEVSDQLSFDVTVLNGFDLRGVTKTVTLTIADTRSALWEYQVCFQAPYEFPAIVLDGGNDSENLDLLLAAISLGEFAAEPVGGGEFRGLLLPCGLVAPVSPEQNLPCIQSRTDLGATVEIVLRTPAEDPGARW